MRQLIVAVEQGVQVLFLALVTGGAARIHEPAMPPPLLTCPPSRQCVCQERRVNEWARLVLVQDSYRWLK